MQIYPLKFRVLENLRQVLLDEQIYRYIILDVSNSHTFCVCLCLYQVYNFWRTGIRVKIVPDHLLIGQFKMSWNCHPITCEQWGRDEFSYWLGFKKTEIVRKKLLLKSWLLQNCKQTEVLELMHLPFKEERNLQEKYTCYLSLAEIYPQNLFERVLIN